MTCPPPKLGLTDVWLPQFRILAGPRKQTCPFSSRPVSPAFFAILVSEASPHQALGSGLSTYFDRSFDVHYQIFDEKQYRPALAVGLRDFLGTGLYSGEYVVATKSVGPKLRLTGGLGWGRLGSHGSFAVMGSRPTQTLGSGGIPNYDRWFRGPVAGFAGINYNHNDRLGFSVEYSSDHRPGRRSNPYVDGYDDGSACRRGPALQAFVLCAS